MASPAMVRESGEIWLGLQVQHGFGDPSRDLGAVLLKALDAEPGIVGLLEAPGEGLAAGGCDESPYPRRWRSF